VYAAQKYVDKSLTNWANGNILKTKQERGILSFFRFVSFIVQQEDKEKRKAP
jgi:hypothetical protein